MINSQKFADTAEDFVSSRLFHRLTLIWFALQATLFAVFTRVSLPPDESWHFSLIQLYKRNGVNPFIQNQSGYYFLGEVTHNVGWLYHYTISLLVRPVSLLCNDRITMIFIRLLSVLLGIATLIVVSKIADRLKVGNFTKNVAIFLLANTAMFVVMFGSVSYDSLFIFLSATFVYSLIAYMDKKDANTLLLLYVITLLGAMTKFAFVPLALFGLVCLSVVVGLNHQVFFRNLKNNPNRRKTKLLLLTALMVSVMFVLTYGKNLVQYGSPTPSCDRVLSIELCMQNEVYARDRQFNSQPIVAARFPFDVFILLWSKTMVERTYGIFASQSYPPLSKALRVVYLMGFISAVATIREYKRKDNTITIIALISIAYIVVLLLTNWRSYLSQGRFGVGLQGRYALPVLPYIYIISTFYLTKMLSNKITRLAVIVLIIFLSFLLGMPTYLIKSNATWRSISSYSGRMQLHPGKYT